MRFLHTGDTGDRHSWKAYLLSLLAMSMVLAACNPLGGSPSPINGMPGGSQPKLPVGTASQGWASELTSSTSMPPGMNVWSCKPGKVHPYPVILVHGTFANEAFSWQALSPMLANAGYCVYGMNYGAEPETLGHFYGLAPIQDSAKQLASLVEKVLKATGATQVDMVGWSLGGMMPRYYIKFLHGASKVHMLVGLAPTNHGTTASGLVTIAKFFQSNFGFSFNQLNCYSCTQQEQGSSFLAKLNAGGDTVPGPKYVVIESKYDEVVTPYTSAFLSGSGVQNITLQNQCSTDFTEHLGIIYDPVALQDVINALGADSSKFKPHCSVVLPVFS
ncbi:MAG: esterase/lipase family protein [Acidimicrobiales bacterium]